MFSHENKKCHRQHKRTYHQHYSKWVIVINCCAIKLNWPLRNIVCFTGAFRHTYKKEEKKLNDEKKKWFNRIKERKTSIS